MVIGPTRSESLPHPGRARCAVAAVLTVVGLHGCAAYDRAHYAALIDAREGDATAADARQDDSNTADGFDTTAVTDGLDTIASDDVIPADDDVPGSDRVDTHDVAQPMDVAASPDVVVVSTDAPVDSRPPDAPDVACPAGSSACDGVCIADTAASCGCARVDCRRLPNVLDTTRCVAGRCDLTTACRSSFANCDADASNGCEARLDSPTSCGACDVRCTAVTPACVVATGGNRCSATCPAPTTLCSSVCVNLSTDRTNCGACGFMCVGALPCNLGHCG